MPFVKSGELVTPGQELCVEEEFIAGEGTYVDNGIVRAAVVGVVEINMNTYVITVEPIKSPSVIKPKSVVIGKVIGMREELAYIKVAQTEQDFKRRKFYTVLLHVSQLGVQKFVKSMYDYLRIGDVVKVRILNDKPIYVASMKGNKLGVILAYCSLCGNELYLDGDKLVCPRCGNVEQRKLSSEYLLRKKK